MSEEKNQGEPTTEAAPKDGRLDIVDPSEAHADAMRPDAEPEPEAPVEAPEDVQAMVGIGCTPDEARSLAAAGVARRVREAIARAGRKAEPAEDAEDGSGEAGAPAEAPPDRIKALEAQIAALAARLDRVPDAIDDLLGRSGRTSLFGDGRSAPPDPQQAANRAAVRAEADVLRRGYVAAGRAVPDDATLVQRAIALAFPEAVGTQPSDAVARRQQQFTARPTSRMPAPAPDGVEKAVASVAARLKEIARR